MSKKKRLSLRPININRLGGGFIHEFRAAQRRRDYKVAGKIKKGFASRRKGERYEANSRDRIAQ
jgi:hypothetical protein